MMGGMGSTDPNERWMEYTGGRPVWRREDITDPSMQRLFDFMARRVGSTNGEITREQFLGMTQQFSNMTRGGGAPMSGGSPGGGAPGTPMGMAPSPQGPDQGGRPMSGNWMERFGRSGDRGGDRGDVGRDRGGDRRDRGGPGGWNSDMFSEMIFRRADGNGDGLINYDEMSDTLKEERDRYDTNHDGFVDASEFREYIRARMEQVQQAAEGGDGRGGRGDPRGGSAPIQIAEEEEKRPVVYRSGKLPPNLPSWFRECDRDSDGQVALYEWRGTGRVMDDFEPYDRNSDGFITAEEAIWSMTSARNSGGRGNGDSNATARGLDMGRMGEGFGMGMAPWGQSGPGGGDPRSMFRGGPGSGNGGPGGGDLRSMFRGGPGGGDPRSMFRGGPGGGDPRSMFRGGPGGGDAGSDPRSMFRGGAGGGPGGGDPRSMFRGRNGGDSAGPGGGDPRSMFRGGPGGDNAGPGGFDPRSMFRGRNGGGDSRGGPGGSESRGGNGGGDPRSMFRGRR
jgi:hypothetical protein